jgi:hypothetical protein
MSQPTSPFTLGVKTQNPFEQPIKGALASMAAAPVSTQPSIAHKRYNPFMAALNAESQEFKDVYGVNKPLEQPMFLGYHDNKPVYGGNRLFILY